MQILLVEDDAMLAQAVGDGVRQQGWELDWVANAGAAKTMLVDHGYSAVLLDLHLPGSSGLSVLRALRERYDTTPVLIITARDQLSERVRGLDAGADDYVVKPFQFDELYARLRAVLRRSQGRVAPLLSCGELQLDPSRREVTFRGQPAALSLHEYRTLFGARFVDGAQGVAAQAYAAGGAADEFNDTFARLMPACVLQRH